MLPVSLFIKKQHRHGYSPILSTQSILYHFTKKGYFPNTNNFVVFETST